MIKNAQQKISYVMSQTLLVEKSSVDGVSNWLNR